MSSPNQASTTTSSSSLSRNDGSQQVVVKKEEPSSLAYIIALITIGAAFGNMFMAGKIRNVMRAEMPKAGQAASGYSNGPRQTAGAWEEGSAGAAQQRRQQQQEQWKQRFEEQFRQHHQQKSKFDRDDFEFFDPRIDHLKKLGLSLEQNNEKAIKARYRELVMKYHPDRIVDDEKLKEQHQQTFQEISNSYQSLMKYLTLKK